MYDITSHDDEKEEAEVYRKPTHDGRLNYHKVFEKMSLALEAARMMGDLESWYRTLAAAYGKAAPFCKKEDMKDLPAKMAEAKRLVQALRNLQRGGMMRYPNVAMQYALTEQKLESLLSEIHESFHFATREMMLPLKAEDDDTLDLDKSLRGSGV